MSFANRIEITFKTGQNLSGFGEFFISFTIEKWVQKTVNINYFS